MSIKAKWFKYASAAALAAAVMLGGAKLRYAQAESAPELEAAAADDDDGEGGEGNISLSDRGSPADYDPGPPKNSKWAEFFSKEVPNYRGLGLKIVGGEKFRWTFGPMFYRGRLTPNSVKVFIVGQEGAQDESVSNRSFTGGTGARVQALLKHIGITKNYLFMNTFEYTINGQYDSPEIHWIAQDKSSPVRKHREEMFDYMLSQNKGTLKLVIAVGKAAKESVMSWVESHGGNCEGLKTPKYGSCDGEVFGKGVQIVGFPHPGGAGKGADINELKAEFNKGAQQIAKWMTAGAWLKPDTAKNTSPSKPFPYTGSAIPYADFAYGTNWRLGRGGTSSNRDAGPSGAQQSIAVFSAKGQYGSKHKYVDPKDLASSIDEMTAEDIAWEAPRSVADAYDPGPSAKFAKLLVGEETGFAYGPKAEPGFAALKGGISDPSFGYSGMYRGKLENAQILVLADQESHDDLFSGRALTGADGQRLQTWLNEQGKSYAIIRTLPIDTLGMSEAAVLKLAKSAPVAKIRAEIFRRIKATKKTSQVIALGPVAQKVIGAALTPTEAKKVQNLDYNELPKKLSIIPREDLPIQTKWWVGTSGDRVARSTDAEGDYYRVYMPNWTHKLKSKALSKTEQTAVAKFGR